MFRRVCRWMITFYPGLLLWQFQTTSFPSTIDGLLSHLGWRSLVLFEGTPKEIIISNAVKAQRYTIDNFDLSSTLQDIHDSFSPDINIVVYGNISQVLSVVDLIDQFDLKTKGRTDFRHWSRILIITNDITEMQKANISHLCHVAVAVPAENVHINGCIKTLHPLLVHPHGRVLSLLSGTDVGFVEDKVFPNIKYGYNNRHVIVATIETFPYVVKQNKSGDISFDGYAFDIWRTIAARLNISYTITEGKTWGVNRNGSWNGIVAQLIRKEVDVSVCDLTVFYERARDVDFLFPSIMVDAGDVLYKRQTDATNTFLLLLQPLRPEVLLIYVAVCLAIGVIFLAMTQYLDSERKPPQGLHKQLLTLCHVLGDFLGTTIRHQLRTPTTTQSSRMLLVSWWLLVLLITTAYGANLIATLSSQAGLSKLTSIDELVDSEYIVGIVANTSTFNRIQNSDQPKIKRLFDKIDRTRREDPSILIKDIARQLERVKQGGYAMVMQRAPTDRAMNEDCLLARIGEHLVLSEEHIALAVPKHSTLRNSMQNVMYDLRESGVLDLLWRKWTRVAGGVPCSEKKHLQAPISLYQVWGYLLLVLAGVGGAAILLILECLCSRQRG